MNVISEKMDGEDWFVNTQHTADKRHAHQWCSAYMYLIIIAGRPSNSNALKIDAYYHTRSKPIGSFYLIWKPRKI